MKYGSLFKSQNIESPEVQLSVKGILPQWLAGNLIRTGPALFDIKNRRLNHLFDGLAMLYKLTFSGIENTILFKSRFIESDAYTKAMAQGKLASCEFGTNPERSRLQVFMAAFNFKATDNPNVNVVFMNNRAFASTETPYLCEFDSISLETIGKMQFADQLKGQVTTAHPHFDFKTGELINFLVEYGPTSAYHLFRWKAGDEKRKLIASVKTKNPGYLHSFALSEKYVVLILGPLVVNPLELLFSGKPFIANFKWKAHLGSRIYVIDRQSGKITSFETDPLFVFHHINARDEKEKIIVDFLAYNDSSIVDDLYLKNLDTGNQPAVPLPTRLHIDLNTNSLTKEALHDKGLELPIINYKKCSTKEYKYFYAVGEKVRGDFLNQLVKTEWENNKTSHRFWYEKDCFPGEPIFVANPRPVENREDDGILLSIVTNSQENRSFILGLDARDMSEMFRAELPHIVPFNFHGQFREIAK